MRPIYETQHYRGDDTGHFIVEVLSFLIIVMVVFGLVVLLTKYAQKQAGVSTDKSPDPQAIIKTRYAQGEITKDEFEQLKKDLK